MTYKEAVKRLWKYKFSFSEGITEEEYDKDLVIFSIAAIISVIPLVILFYLLLPEIDTYPDIVDYGFILIAIWVITYLVLMTAFGVRYYRGLHNDSQRKKY